MPQTLAAIDWLTEHFTAAQTAASFTADTLHIIVKFGTRDQLLTENNLRS